MRHKARQHHESVGFTEEKLYSCQQCGKQFGKVSKLTQHMKTHRCVMRCVVCRVLMCLFVLAPRITTNTPVISAVRSSPGPNTLSDTSCCIQERSLTPVLTVTRALQG